MAIVARCRIQRSAPKGDAECAKVRVGRNVILFEKRRALPIGTPQQASLGFELWLNLPADMLRPHRWLTSLRVAVTPRLA